MRAAVYPNSGVPEEIHIETIDDPSPSTTEVVVRVQACSLNHRDLWKLTGIRDSGDGAFVGGADVAGIVEAVGDHVSHVEPGDRVLLFPLSTCGTCRYCREGPENFCADYDSYDGGFAEQCVVDAERLLVLPDNIEFVTAAALPIAYVTAWRMYERANVTVGDKVLIPGATGGLGLAAVQLATVWNVIPVGTTRSAAKAERLKARGVDHVIHAETAEDMTAAVANIGEMDAMLNHLGCPFVEAGLSTLQRNGTMVICGRTAGERAEIDLWDLYFHHRHIVGSTLGTQTDLEQLLEFVETSRLDPVIDSTYPLSEIGDAFAKMQNGDAFGKLIICPSNL
jgi:NADPH:quinone reductase-like Zn-dependent oxidoreductase